MTTARAANKPKKPSFQAYVTPWHIFRAIQDECFDGAECGLDACADEHNTKAKRFWSMKENGLAQPWFDWTFYNPPYAEQARWLEKAAREAERGVRSAGLLKLAASESYWRPIAYELAEQQHYEGRIPFLAPKGGIWLITKKGRRYIPEGHPIKGSDFASALVLMGPGFKPRTLRYRWAKTGRLVVPEHTILEVRR